MMKQSDDLMSWLYGRDKRHKYTICSFCHGSGKVRSKKCPICDGFGVVPTSNRRYFGY